MIGLLAGCRFFSGEASVLIVPPAIDSFHCKDNDCVYYRVDKPLFPIRQPTAYSCWATVLTMLLSWQEGKLLDINATMGRFGRKYQDLLRQSDQQGIQLKDELTLYKIAHIDIMQQLNPSIDGWAAYLKDYGPLSVTIEANPPFGGTVHAILVTGIYGRKDASHTLISYIDPLDGREHLIDFMQFIPMYEGKYSVDWLIQVIHLPK